MNEIPFPETAALEKRLGKSLDMSDDVRRTFEKTVGPLSRPKTPVRHLSDGGGPERRKVIAELRKVERRLLALDAERVKLDAERHAAMEAVKPDRARVDALTVEIQKLVHEHELAEAAIRGWVKRAEIAEKADADALADRVVKVMAAAKVKYAPATERFSAAQRELEASIREAFEYERLVNQVAPLADGVEIPRGENVHDERLLEWLLITMQKAIADRLHAVKRFGPHASDDPIENYERLEAIVDEIEK